MNVRELEERDDLVDGFHSVHSVHSVHSISDGLNVPERQLPSYKQGEGAREGIDTFSIQSAPGIATMSSLH
jgi:hypothetical protein